MKKLILIPIVCGILGGCNSNPSSEKKMLVKKSYNFLEVSKNENTEILEQEIAIEQSENSEDLQLALAIEQVILSDRNISPSNKSISISIQNGVVTLTGTVSNKFQINRIIKRIKTVKGVELVDSQLIVYQSDQHTDF